MVSFKHLVLAGLSCSAILPERIKSGQGQVQFDLVCNATAIECAQVKDVLFAAGECLNNVIEIKEPIIVSLRYYDFCAGKEKCDSSAVGQASHNDLELGGKYKNYFYPQALVKQIGTKEMVSGRLNKYDIDISLNSNYTFQMVGKVNFTNQEYSLVSVVSHELLHGLGIASFTSSFSPKQNLAVPKYETDDKEQLRFIQNVFDSHLYIRETEKPLSSIVDKLNSLPKITKPQNSSALMYPPYIETVDEFSALLTTPNSIYFLTNNHSKVYIETGLRAYNPGSTLHHLDQSYITTMDFAMIYHATTGDGKDSLSDYLGWYTAPFGPLTIEVLATMGYTLKKPTWGHSLGGIVQLLRQDKSFIQEIDHLIPLNPIEESIGSQ